MKAKRYLVFAGDVWEGGWLDVQSTHDDLVEARNARDQEITDADWAHVVDLETGEIVYPVEIPR